MGAAPVTNCHSEGSLRCHVQDDESSTDEEAASDDGVAARQGATLDDGVAGALALAGVPDEDQVRGWHEVDL